MKIYFSLLILHFILGFTIVFGQENPNVELPKFVITGKESDDFPQLEKQKPELVSTVSEQFFKPVYSPDALEIKEFSEPVKKSGEFLDSITFLNGEGNFLIGNNKLPSVSFTYRLPMERALFSAGIDALNRRAYLPNADRNSFGAKANYNYIVQDSSGFLPFSKLHIAASVENNAYKLFASPVPEFKRQVFSAGVVTSLQNLSSSKFNYELTVEDNFLNMKNDLVKENLLKVNGYTKFSFSHLSVGLSAKYHLVNSTFPALMNEKVSFIQGRGILGLSIGDAVKTNFGIEYSSLDTNASIFPYAAVSYHFGKGITLFAEYHPASAMLTQKDFLASNDYYSPSIQFKNIFYTIDSRYSFQLKYEYERLFEISGGLSIYSTKNFPYFRPTLPAINVFQVDTIEAQAFSFFSRINMYAGSLGFFTGEINYQNVIDTSGNSIPFVTPLKINMVYGLFVTPEISFSASMMYYSSAFTNFANTEKAKDYFNLSVRGEMMISENMSAQLEVENLLNKKNERWKNYQELPLSISAGIKINW